MSTTTQRPTPETDDIFDAYARCACGTACVRAKMQQIERERDEVREELENILNVIPADAPCLHAETGETVADYILDMQKEVGRVHALYFNDKQQLEAMREAIKEACEAFRDLMELQPDVPPWANTEATLALAKLQPFLKP